jgi:DUF4097 and DUF4098 domain-containing protein YvlB
MADAAPQRSSIFAGLLLILLGLIFLANRFYPALGLGHLIRLYWPLLIITWGVAKLVDHLGTPSGEARPSILSGGEAALLILIVFVMGAFVFRDWICQRFPEIVLDLPAFGPEVSRNENLSPLELPPGARLAIETNAGDIKVTGTDGEQLRVGVRERTHGRSRTEDETGIVIDHMGDTYRVHPTRRDAGEGSAADLDVSAPHTADLSMTTTKGDLSAEGMAGAVRAADTDGDITIHKASGDVSADLQSGDVRIDGVAGNVAVHGRGDDVAIENVEGEASIDGDFIGDLRLRNVRKATHIRSLRSELSAGGAAGEISLNSEDISISSLYGPLKLGTRDKDIRITGATGDIDLADTRGDIRIVYSGPPQHNLTVANDSGDIDVTLPANSYFNLSAVSRSGEIECDFAQPGTKGEGDGDAQSAERLSGTFGAPNGNASPPRISIETSYGTIHIHKGG